MWRVLLALTEGRGQVGQKRNGMEEQKASCGSKGHLVEPASFSPTKF